MLYSFATQRFSRGALFNIVVGLFMVWFVAFGFLYPSHEAMHFHGLAESVLEGLPSGLAGAVGMVRLPSSPTNLLLCTPSIAAQILVKRMHSRLADCCRLEHLWLMH